MAIENATWMIFHRYANSLTVIFNRRSQNEISLLVSVVGSQSCGSSDEGLGAAGGGGGVVGGAVFVVRGRDGLVLGEQR